MAYDNDNIFAKILCGEIPCDKIYEDDFVLAFKDIQPAAKVHVLVIPKAPYVSFDDFIAGTRAQGISQFFRAVHMVAKQMGVDETGYRLITNHGADASQTVPHFHVHLLAGELLGGLLADDVLNL
jgi:diadenosine tetraphosphate (Ap4A) HIT family hydrolase